MPYQAKVYRILIASPSDAKSERDVVVEVINAWNVANAPARGFFLEAVHSETHATPELGARPQAIINRQIVQTCDMLVGIFWTRLGTPTGVAESGTVEEIEEFVKAGKPVFLYFSSTPVAPDSVDLDQYKRLQSFRERIETQGLVGKVGSVEELRRKFQVHLAQKMHELSSDGKGTGGTAPVSLEPQSKAVSPLTRLKEEYSRYLSRLETEWSSEKDSEQRDMREGKNIIAKAHQSLLDFRTDLARFMGTADAVNLFDQAIKEMIAMQRHKLNIIDPGSFEQFWEMGDAVIALLEQARRVLGPSYTFMDMSGRVLKTDK